MRRSNNRGVRARKLLIILAILFAIAIIALSIFMISLQQGALAFYANKLAPYVTVILIIAIIAIVYLKYRSRKCNRGWEK